MNFEEEMSRFEAEIRRSAAMGGAMAGAMPQHLGLAFHHPRPGHPHHLHPGFMPTPLHMIQASLPPPSLAHISALGPPNTLAAMPAISAPSQTVISALPQTTTVAKAENDEDDMDILAKLEQYEKEMGQAGPKKSKKKSKSKTNLTPSVVSKKPVAATLTAPPSLPQPEAPIPSLLPAPPIRPSYPPPAAAAATSSAPTEESGKKGKKQKRIVRTGGGQVWEDNSLKEWDQNDFRIFCGDLGNDVTEEVLARQFGRYPSFQKAKVVRDKRTNKTKGYGFVSFKDPTDFTKAMREMNGKYVGSRPIKLRKSNWRDRNIDQVKQKQKVKQQMGYKW